MKYEDYIKKYLKVEKKIVLDFYLSGIKIATSENSDYASNCLNFLSRHLIISITHRFGQEHGRLVYVGYSSKENTYFVWTNKSVMLGTDYISDLNNDSLGTIADNYLETLKTFSGCCPVAFEGRDPDFAQSIAVKFAQKLLEI